jgi:hypothetical protein
MNLRFVVPGILGLLLYVGCIPMHPKLFLYPVKGPMSDQNPPSAITASTRGFTSGSISFRLPTGEVCEGPWTLVPSGQMASGLAEAWDLVFGQGYYTAHVLGAKQHGTSTIRGDRGSEFRLEFYRDTVEGSPLLGVAKDAAGNVYKVAQ